MSVHGKWRRVIHFDSHVNEYFSLKFYEGNSRSMATQLAKQWPRARVEYDEIQIAFVENINRVLSILNELITRNRNETSLVTLVACKFTRKSASTKFSSRRTLPLSILL